MINKTGQSAKNIMSEHANALNIAKSILISYLITIPVFAIFAYILILTDFPQKYISTFVIITTLLSVVIAGWSSTKHIKSKGWLNGGIVGFFYMLVLFLLSSSSYGDFSINIHVITMFIIGTLTGSIGGILGINLRKEPRVGKIKNF
ncbi:MAG TPA: TIGR04086 family membrane protein [Ruminiclostridium sp.]|jgi:putative membrane protein (TIGR04086 family)|uniref:TIGR04086 family membrane protein n=1 Tax=Acetivibrio saccincola TaxID=1677857 RepID=UPI000EBCEABC|nr:TIGR04086 family membrane protein [Acetivibrio saccincola]NLW27874.1 TIGR04086 family membrane protein [Acetivibrio saccincola]HAA43359.1 TIGR04086 family membrane protein [Ruminiclostridium sp.]